jgi:2-Cys peroxiredoxin 5
VKGRVVQFVRYFTELMPVIKVGDKLPSVELQEGNPMVKINIADLFSGKRGIIFGVPGPFTPTCSKVL